MSTFQQTLSPDKLRRPVVWTATTLVFASVATLVAWQLAPRWTTAASSPEATAPPLPVNVMPVEYVESIEQQRSYTGLIRPQLESQLAFELSGVILSVEVDDGDHVAPGDLIATLDTKILEAQAAAVTAQLSQAKEVLNELEAGPRAEQIAAAKASFDAAKATAKNAETRRQRREKLVAQGALPPEEFDQATFDAQAALAQQEAAAQRLAELEAGTRPEKKAAQRAMIQQLEASKKEIEVALEKSHLKALFGGTVVRRFLDPGSIAGPQTPVVKLVKSDQLEAWIGLPVSLAATIKPDSVHDILVGGHRYPCIARSTIQELDRATRTQRIVLSLPSNAAPSVVPGQLCEIELTSTVDTDGYWIPKSALAKGIRGLWSVMVAKQIENGDWIARKHDIEIVKTTADRVLARGTLQTDDRIIVDGLHRITDGQLIRPLETADVSDR